MLWVLVVMWAIAAAAFLSSLDKRKLAVVMILLSLLVLLSMLRSTTHVPPLQPAFRPVSAPQTTGPM